MGGDAANAGLWAPRMEQQGQVGAVTRGHLSVKPICAPVDTDIYTRALHVPSALKSSVNAEVDSMGRTEEEQGWRKGRKDGELSGWTGRWNPQRREMCL